MNEPSWDAEADVLVVGTGAAALSAAITAADAGLSVLVLESTALWGGSSSMSGGGIWLPNNPLMQRAGAADSREEALDYLEQTVGDAGPATSRERKVAFVDGVSPFVSMAERLGMRFARASDYPDYYPELAGGKIGRAIEISPFDVRRIPQWWPTSRGRRDGVPAPVMTDDFWLLQRAWVTAGGFARGARVAGRVAASVARLQWRVGMGAGLSCALLDVALRQGTRVWLDCPMQELVVEDGRVVGVIASRDGRQLRLGATHGVVLGAGGFDHNASWRQEHQGVDGSWSSGSEGNLGSAIDAGQAVGAAVDLMDDAWWGASVPSPGPDSSPMFMVSERSVPYSIIVDASGARFANESESYVDLGHHMFDRAASVPGRFWMVTDARHARRYLRSYAMDPRVRKAQEAAGISHRADSVRELATKIGVDADRLEATVARFNGLARSGVDHDFGRGNSAYDRYYGDPTVHPNPNLGALERGPFSAIEVVAGDLGTKGGLMTDARARVLRTDGSPIAGLYAAGNCSASVMGRTYPGPGSTLGPATVFGHLAARDIADRATERVRPAA